MNESSLDIPRVWQAVCLARGRHGPRLWHRKPGRDLWKEQVEKDPEGGQLRERIREQAEALLAAPLLERVLEGRRLLAVSRECLNRVALLDFGWRLSGDDRLAGRAAREVLAVCGFPDWNPSHFLDTAEMSLAVAWALDTFGNRWAPAVRRSVEEALVRLGLDAGEANPDAWWIRATNNWGQVCHAGMTAAALVLLERDPERAARVIHRAVVHLPLSMAVYAPDGGYPEGPSYWGYGTTFNVLLIEMLENGLGTDFGLSEQEGFSKTGLYIQEMQGPTGLFFNYADGAETGYAPSVLYWFSERFGTPVTLAWIAATRRRWKGERGAGHRANGREGGSRFGLELLWLPPVRPEDEKHVQELPLDWQDRGVVPVAVFRSRWNDSEAWFVGFKAGSPSHNHGHMDAGSFVLEAYGVRWAVDLGAESYHRIESLGLSLWDRQQNSDRWRVFRLNNFSHNTLTIDGALHRVEGQARLSHFVPDPASPWAEADLTPVYASQVAQAVRRLTFLERRGLVVADHLQGLRPGACVEWGMMTRATVASEGSDLLLSQNGRRLRLMASGTPGHWEVRETDPPPAPHDSPNPGVRRVCFVARAPGSGNLAFEVRLTAG
jgi:hypothetical protein